MPWELVIRYVTFHREVRVLDQGQHNRDCQWHLMAVCLYDKSA